MFFFFFFEGLWFTVKAYTRKQSFSPTSFHPSIPYEQIITNMTASGGHNSINLQQFLQETCTTN
ncbi:hypothetical protein ACB094_09G041500 [Castanea mollissima]